MANCNCHPDGFGFDPPPPCPNHDESPARRLVNLTPHVITILNETGVTATVPASGVVARRSVRAEKVPPHGGISLTATVLGAVTDLPAPVDGVLYIVSAIVRAGVPERIDVASPGDLVRDAAGQPVGCRGLVVNPPIAPAPSACDCENQPWDGRKL